MTNYKGESPGKKVARFRYWNKVEKRGLLGDFGKIVVLASREGGDVSVLTALGIEPSRIVAVDADKEAADAVAEKFPLVTSIHGDVREVVDRNTSHVFLDLCSPMCTTSIELVHETIDRLHPSSSFGVAVLKGREQDGEEISLGSRSQRRALKAVNKRFAAIGSNGSARELARRHIFPERHKTDSRAMILSAAILNTLPRSAKSKPLFHIPYHSRTADAQGVPMLIVGYGPNVGDALYEPEDEFPLKECERIVREVSVLEAGHLLMNIPKSTAAAWKAHATRRSGAAP